MTRRTPTGAAVLQTSVTEAITEAVLDEWAEHGYGRLSMEAVAKRAGVGKSALYRRWASKEEMAMSVISEILAAETSVPDTGSLRGDVRAALDAIMELYVHPRFSRILPDLAAEAARNPELGHVNESMVCTPRREQSRVMFERAIERGEVPADLDMELVLDLVVAPIYWRLSVRRVEAGPGYLDGLTDMMIRAMSSA
ncbi:TetR/AcrR family transcriptional regulator [Nonomuraea sp. PA05]|uniref:TetR/AcrR family transcriptional regulator n=1 Tax=Nonomuraea sp. PA05 TaxID=2604466 RepID=UPI0011D82737|nr:TetR/AcrR family transcriptional regulator [Nonomuraea sp. PA05]TYB64405.1 TetR/AcrR family transcriptional regulator [Nonomuraea sp. PA05]